MNGEKDSNREGRQSRGKKKKKKEKKKKRWDKRRSNINITYRSHPVD